MPQYPGSLRHQYQVPFFPIASTCHVMYPCVQEEISRFLRSYLLFGRPLRRPAKNFCEKRELGSVSGYAKGENSADGSSSGETRQPWRRKRGPCRGCRCIDLSFGDNKRQQGDCSRPFDGHGQFPLMLCTISRVNLHCLCLKKKFPATMLRITR